MAIPNVERGSEGWRKKDTGRIQNFERKRAPPFPPRKEKSKQ